MDEALSTPDPAQTPCHWTSYPYLLGELETDESRTAIERVAEYRLHSQYKEAQEAFNAHFPNKFTHTILVLEYAKLLVAQLLDGQLVVVIDEAIQTLRLEPSSSEFILLQMMRAWAGLMGTGNLTEALEHAREARKPLMDRPKQELNTAEVSSPAHSWPPW
jgi:hypothetical protein